MWRIVTTLKQIFFPLIICIHISDSKQSCFEVVFFSILLELYEKHQMHDSFELLRYYQTELNAFSNNKACFTTFPLRARYIWGSKVSKSNAFAYC